MPRVNRRPKKRTSGYTPEHLYVLRYGHDFWGLFSGGMRGPRNSDIRDMDAVLQAWEALGGEILKDWIRCEPPNEATSYACPGTRPWAWWEFDAPELRRRTDGKPHPFENPDRIAHVAEKEAEFPGYAERAMRVWYGLPALFCTPDDFGAEYETQLNHLKRLDLLLPGELELVEEMLKDDE